MWLHCGPPTCAARAARAAQASALRCCWLRVLQRERAGSRRRSAAAQAEEGLTETSGSEVEAVVDEAVLDNLISLFRKRPREDWRRMLAVSAEWPRLAAPVFQRLDSLVQAAGEDELELLRLRRTLAESHEEWLSFRRLFDEFLLAPSEDWEGLAGVRRASLSPAFFEYLQFSVASLDPVKQAQAREELASAAARLSALVEMHDTAVRDADQLDDSFKRFQELLSGVSSLADMDTKLDALLASGQVDPALLLTTSKMYMSVKESPYTSEEVKDIMAHLYWRMKASMAERQPAEVRILKHLLSTEDPLERFSLTDSAFTPGPELTVGEGQTAVDFLSTTPEKLLGVISAVLGAYDAQRGRVSMQGQAAELMTPAVIERMRLLAEEVRQRYT